MCLLFFVFKQKTAYELRISDWSSDVCSSDLNRDPVAAQIGDEGGTALDPRRQPRVIVTHHQPVGGEIVRFGRDDDEARPILLVLALDEGVARDQQIGRASCRERVCQYV